MAVKSADTGSYTISCINALGKSCSETVPQIGWRHQIELGSTLCCNGTADQTTSLSCHKSDLGRGNQFSSADQVAFIFSVFIICDDHQFACLDIGDQLFRCIELEFTNKKTP